MRRPTAALPLEQHPADAPSPCPAPLQRPCLPGLAGTPLPFLGSNSTIRALRVPPAPRAAALYVTYPSARSPLGWPTAQRTPATLGKAWAGGSRPPGTAATRQAPGASPGGAAQGSKYHRSGAVFFTTAALLCIFIYC